MGFIPSAAAGKGPERRGERRQGEFSDQVHQSGRVRCHIRGGFGHWRFSQRHRSLHGHADKQNADRLLLQLARIRLK